MSKIKTVLFDLDGTLVDFELAVKEHTGVECVGRNQSVIDDFLEREVPNKLFTTLKPLPDFDVMRMIMTMLEERGMNIAFLSSCTHQWFDSIYEQKVIWLDQYGLSKYNLFGVQHSKDKGLFAEKDSLLIDDYHVSVDSFIQSGGYAIKHTSANETYSSLKLMGVL